MPNPAYTRKKGEPTALDRLWQEWKKRHPTNSRAQFRQWLEARPKAYNAVVKGKGYYRYGGYQYMGGKGAKPSVMVGTAAAANKRKAGMASGLHPAKYGPWKAYYGAMKPALARQYERQIRAFFLSRGNKKAAAQARRFVMAGAISGFDPRFLAAIAEAESSGFQAVPGNAPWNGWGWSVNTGQSSSDVSGPFGAPQSAFAYYGEHFGRNYKGSNLMRDFGPYAADTGWESNVGAALRQMGGNPSDVRWAPFQGRNAVAI